jgi:hypothetical protein
MDTRKLVEEHPASKLARRHLKEQQDGRMISLLQLALEFLDRLPARHPLLELEESLPSLANLPPLMQAQFPVADYQTLMHQLRHSPATKAWAVLKEHLDGLLVRIKDDAEADELGHLLATNVYASLQHTLPSFGLPSVYG